MRVTFGDVDLDRPYSERSSDRNNQGFNQAEVLERAGTDEGAGGMWHEPTRRMRPVSMAVIIFMIAAAAGYFVTNSITGESDSLYAAELDDQQETPPTFGESTVAPQSAAMAPAAQPLIDESVQTTLDSPSTSSNTTTTHAEPAQAATAPDAAESTPRAEGAAVTSASVLVVTIDPAFVDAVPVESTTTRAEAGSILTTTTAATENTEPLEEADSQAQAAAIGIDTDSVQVESVPSESTSGDTSASIAEPDQSQSSTTSTTQAATPTTATIPPTTTSTTAVVDPDSESSPSLTLQPRPTINITTSVTWVTRPTTDDPNVTWVTRPDSTTVPEGESSTTSQPDSTTEPSQTTTVSQVESTGRVLFEDHFDDFDRSVWRPEHSTYGDGNSELQCYRPENVWVDNGKLILRAVEERYTCPNGSTRRVTSGMVRSDGVSFSPGQSIEFRVKLNPANAGDQAGLWPAVWASGWDGGGWPSAGELDFLEVMTAEDSQRAMFSVHYEKSRGGHGVNNKGAYLADHFSAEWHTIRFDYGYNGTLTWFMDGEQIHSVSYLDTDKGWPGAFDGTINEIKINLAVGGTPGPLSDGAVGDVGATFEVDYIRITSMN